MAKGRKTGGRVHGYPKNRELVEDIIRFVSNGGTVSQWFRVNEPPFDMSTFYDWVEEFKDLGERYSRAKDRRCSIWAEETIDIAEDGRNDWEERETRNGGTYIALNREAIERSKLRIGQRNYERERWAARKAQREGQKSGTSLEAIFAAISAFEATKAALADHGQLA